MALRWFTLPILMAVASSLMMPCGARAQEISFGWSFADNRSPRLVECESIRVAMNKQADGSHIGSPPYYVVAYELDGIVTVSEIGSDAGNLSWLVNHRAGSNVLVSVVDSQGRGGSVSSLYPIQAGSSASCLPSAPSRSPLLAINVKRDRNTCELHMNEGTPPYTVSIAEAGASVTNLTLGSEDHTFTYINRAAPDTDVFVSVSDANGIWAGQTLSINTFRPSDPACGASGDRISSRGLLDAEVPGAAANGSQQSAHHIALIIGICIGVAVCMIILCFVAFVFFLRRTGRWRWGRKGSQDAMPRTWTSDGGGDTTLVANTFISPLKNKRSHDFAKMKSRSEPKLTLDTIDDDSNSRTSPCTIDDTQTSSSIYNHPRLRLDIEVLDISPANNPDPSPPLCSTKDVGAVCSPERAERFSPSVGGTFPSSSVTSTPIRPLPTPPTRSRFPFNAPSTASPLSPASRPLPPTPTPVTPASPLSPPHSRRHRDVTTPTSSAPSSHPTYPRSDHRPLQLHSYDSQRGHGHLRSYRSTPNVRPSASSSVISPIHSSNPHTRPHGQDQPRPSDSNLLSRARTHERQDRNRGVPRSRSFNTLRTFEQGTLRESWTEDRLGRDVVILQHRDASVPDTVVQELPPPYHELNFEHNIPDCRNGKLGGRL